MTEVPKIVHDRLRAVMAGQSSAGPNSHGARHPDADLLTAFVEQALSPAERDGALEHLALCGDCREVIAMALPALDIDIDIAVTPVAGETDAARTMPVAVKALGVKAQRSWLSSPKLAWANLRWATAAAAVGVVASVILLRPGKLNQPTHLPVNNQARTAEPPISGTQIASSTADQVIALAKTGEVRSTPERQSGVRPEMQSAKKPDAGRFASPTQQTEAGMLLADNRFGSNNGNDKDRDEKKKDSLRVDVHSGAITSAPANGGAIVNSPMNSPMSRGATETVEVSAADTAIETAPSLDSTLTAHNEAPAIVKTKPALKEMDTNAGSNADANAYTDANTNEMQTTDAASSPSAVKSQAREFAHAQKIALPANAALLSNATWAIIGGALLRSADSGRSWQSVLRADHLLQCYASHNQNVWAGGLAGTLFHSADGGLTWVRAHPSVKSQSLDSDITHLEVLDSGEIVVSTSKNEIWNSRDGGQTWGRK